MTQEGDNEPVGHPLNDNPWFRKMKALGENLEAGRITQAELTNSRAKPSA